jgi:hypothetical protein
MLLSTQNPRKGELYNFRQAVNDTVKERLGMQTRIDPATGHTRAWFELKEVLKLQVFL